METNRWRWKCKFHCGGDIYDAKIDMDAID